MLAGAPEPGNEGSDCCARAGVAAPPARDANVARATVTKATGFTDCSIAPERCKRRSARGAVVWYKVRVMSDPHVARPAGEASPQDEEPKTPMWLPAVGAALFVGIALWWAVTPSAASPASAEPSASASAAAAAAPNPQAQMPVRPQPAAAPPSTQHARIPMPSALPAELQKRLNDMRGKPHP